MCKYIYKHSGIDGDIFNLFIELFVGSWIWSDIGKPIPCPRVINRNWEIGMVFKCILQYTMAYKLPILAYTQHINWSAIGINGLVKLYKLILEVRMTETGVIEYCKHSYGHW